MSPRIGPLALAVLSLIARLSGAPAVAETLALISYAVLTLVLQRATSLGPAARRADVPEAILPLPVDAPSPLSN